jgi:hypothetical protein
MEKEAKKTNVDFDEFKRLVTLMEDVPQREKETQRDYFERLRVRYGARSRFTMQMIVAALKEAGPDATMEEKYQIYKDKMKGKKKEAEPAEEPEAAEEQVQGQIEMDLTTTKAEMSEQVKMMRFIAGQVDKLYMKLDRLNDTLSMILRAVRKE